MALRWQQQRRLEETILLLLLGSLLCLAFFNSPGTGDVERWLLYMDLARQKGILAVYPIAVINPRTDYPPLSFLILGLFSRLADAFRMGDFVALKLSLALFILACASVTAVLRKGWQPALAVAMFVTLVTDAILLSYTDVYYILFLLLAILCYERGLLSTGTALFAVACLIKWQPIILAPLVLLYVIPRRPTLVDFARLAPAAGIGMVVLLFYAHPMIEAFIWGTENPTSAEAR